MDQDGFDLELLFHKTLMEADTEWKKSTMQRSVIDTRAKRGDVSRCLPSKGSFSYVHIDFDGLGGFAHLIEDTAKFDRLKMLEVVASGPLGHVMINLR